MLLGLGLVEGAAGLTWHSRKTVSIEAGIQNAALGVTMAAIISGQLERFSTRPLPSSVYGIAMYLVAIPFVAWYRTR